MFVEKRPEQSVVFFEQLQGQGFIFLGQGRVAHDGREHDGGQTTLGERDDASFFLGQGRLSSC